MTSGLAAEGSQLGTPPSRGTLQGLGPYRLSMFPRMPWELLGRTRALIPGALELDLGV